MPHVSIRAITFALLKFAHLASQQKKPVTSLNSAPANLWKTNAADFVFLSSISGNLRGKKQKRFSKLSDFADHFRLNLKCAHAKKSSRCCCCTQTQILQTKASNAVSPADAKLVVLLTSRNATKTAKLVNLNIQ
jgi:hypothetical protein